MGTDMTGQTIGHYRIDRLLGQGGMGAVYQAMDLHLEREVALKVMHPHLAAQPQFQQRFLQEARAAARLDHPSIVRVLYFGLEQEQLFLVMELVRGGSLREYLKRLYDAQMFIDLPEGVELVRQITDALHYAHQQGMVHRDIKPDNVILKLTSNEGEKSKFRAVLTDFGLAKLAEGGVHSVTGQPMGTYPYMSPEQCLAEVVDARTDIYALGVMLYELVVGRLPYQPKSITEAIRMHTRDPLPSPDQFRPGLPPELVRVILKSLAKPPADRYQTAGAMARDLQDVQRRLEGGETTMPEVQATRVDSLATFLMSRPLEAGMPAYTPQPLTPSQAEYDRLVIIQVGAPTRAVTIKQDTLRIGRVPDNDVMISGEKVSRYHARVERGADGRYRITDMGSTNGTWLGDMRLQPNVPQVWEPGQVVRIGTFRLQLESARARATTRDRRRVPSPPVSAAGLGLTTAQRPGATATKSAGGNIAMAVAPTNVEVQPGGQAEMTVEVLNQSENVDQFGIQVRGLPHDWITTPSEPLQLLPGDRDTVPVRFHPPRSSQSTAGAHNFQLRVGSHQQRSEVAVINGALQIAPMHSFTADLNPTSVQGKGEILLKVTNTGNATGNYMIGARDRADEVSFHIAQPKFSLSPGQTAHVPIQVSPVQQSFTGGSKTIPFEVTVQTLESGQATKHGELIVAPLIPTWMLGGAGLAVVVCLVLAAVLIAGLGGGDKDTDLEKTNAYFATQTAQVLADAQTRDAQNVIATQTSVANTAIAMTLAAQTAQALGDEDGDGLSNEYERAVSGTLPDRYDTDGDGLSDGDEVYAKGTDPRLWDTDSDGLSDGDEVNRWGTSPTSRDSDGDGVMDRQEVDSGMDPWNPDSDGDGIPDGQDLAPLLTSTPIATQTPFPTVTSIPSATFLPTWTPTWTPTETPSPTPTPTPTQTVTLIPTEPPTVPPTEPPTVPPTEPPTLTPTEPPTLTPTEPPTLTPTEPPTSEPVPPTEVILSGHTGAVWSVMWSPDGLRMAGGGDQSDPSVRIWEVANPAAVPALLPHIDDVRAVAWSPDGSKLATASEDGKVRIWEVATQTQLIELDGGGPGFTVAWSPDGSKLAANAGTTGQILLWDAVSWTPLPVPIIGNHSAEVLSVAWSPDSIHLASASADQTVRVWDVNTGAETTTILGHTDRVNAVTWSPDGARLASASSDQTVRVWDAAGGGEWFQMTGHIGQVNGAAWSPDGARLASAGADSSVRVWDAFSGAQLTVLEGFTANAVAWSPDGTRLAIGSQAMVKIVDVP